MNEQLSKLLGECVTHNASDLHISPKEKPFLRINGNVTGIGDQDIDKDAAEEMALSLLNESQRKMLAQKGEMDISFSLATGERFRGHIYREKHGLALAARKLENRFRSLDELNLPPALANLAKLQDGLVLFTGPTGSGKSTTLATLLDEINRNRPCHILTIEDPIEYVHEGIKSLVHQRELGRDVATFAEAVRASLREDPDVVLVGEMRDTETMRAAIMVAETGHLVFSTLHCGSAVGALDRLIGAFAAHERESLCQQLSMTLRAVVAQHLLPSADGKGRIAAVEILSINKAAANLIRNHKSEQMSTVMEGGGENGMQTIEQSLADLVIAGKITLDVAKSIAQNPQMLERRLETAKRNGVVSPAAAKNNGNHKTFTGRA